MYHGSWVYDSAGPLYKNNSCPVLSQMQNCQGNGRPDREYENWRWKPSHCNLPRFDAKNFLKLMSGKTLAFIGDSVARNQMESLLCALWQVIANFKLCFDFNSIFFHLLTALEVDEGSDPIMTKVLYEYWIFYTFRVFLELCTKSLLDLVLYEYVTLRKE